MTQSSKSEEILHSFCEVMSKLLLDRYQQHLSELELTLPQAQVLRLLRRDGAVPTGQLAAELRITAPAITQLTDRLVRKGLIERQSTVDDRRTVLVALSSKGMKLVEQFRRRRGEAFKGALAELGAAERAKVVESLRKLVGALQSYESKLTEGER